MFVSLGKAQKLSTTFAGRAMLPHRESLDILNKMGFDSPTIVHVGANICQEAVEYNSIKAKSVVWIEALPEIAILNSNFLLNFPGQISIQALLWEKDNSLIKFYKTSNNSESSSVFHLGLSRFFFPGISETAAVTLRTTRLDSLLRTLNQEHINLLVLDTQGSEYQIIRGGENSLPIVDVIEIEVSTVKMYKGQKLFYKVNRILNKHDFSLVYTNLSEKLFHGTAVYVARRLCKDVKHSQNEFHYTTSVIFAFRKTMYVRLKVCYAFLRNLLNFSRK